MSSLKKARQRLYAVECKVGDQGETVGVLAGNRRRAKAAAVAYVKDRHLPEEVTVSVESVEKASPKDSFREIIRG